MDIYNLLLNFKVQSPLAFQKYPGITIRGGLGMSMKSSLCVMGKGKDNCRDCILSETCAYARVFESISLQNDNRMKKASNYPHPFTVTPLFQGPALFREGDEFRLSLSVFGNGVKYLPYIIHSFVKFGEHGAGRERGKFKLSGIVTEGEDPVMIINAGDVDYGRLKPVAVGSQTCGDMAEIEFRTPCRIHRDGREVKNADFTDIIKSLVRKIDNLSALYGSGHAGFDRNELFYKAAAVRKVREDLCWEEMSRFSKRQDNRMKLHGFTGRAVFEGDLAPFQTLLKTAEYINIGKNSSFGFGSVKVDFK